MVNYDKQHNYIIIIIISLFIEGDVITCYSFLTDEKRIRVGSKTWHIRLATTFNTVQHHLTILNSTMFCIKHAVSSSSSLRTVKSTKDLVRPLVSTARGYIGCTLQVNLQQFEFVCIFRLGKSLFSKCSIIQLF